MPKKLNADERKSRFLSRIEKLDGCWNWTGPLDSTKYGVFWNGDRLVGAHIFSYEIHIGETGGLCVMHSCDNPRCVNPMHLSLGTHAQNMKDMKDKKRHAHGSRSGMAKLSESDIPLIRKRLESGEILRTIAEDYGVAKQQISLIKLGKTWCHVGPA